SVSLDLFGGETSTNVGNYFSAGLKGRWAEERRKDDHQLTDASILVDALVDGDIAQREVSALLGLNTDLRREYIADCHSGVDGWNGVLSSAGASQRLQLPHAAFNRKVGAFADIEASPDGEQLSPTEWQAQQDAWLPTDVDKAYVRSLMRPVYER